MNILNIIANTPLTPYGDLENTPKTPLIDGNNLPGMKAASEVFSGIDSLSENLKALVNNINTFNDYFWHPSHLLKPLWIKLDENSMNIFLCIALAGFIAYCIGYKKGSKVTLGSMAAYFLVKYISAAMPK
ncbi:hypothetical protein [Clostridium magnum]|uniref:hypothetical protein n=1 Tax=Clostridium magnum TaxID=33954 RepID=UPI00091CBB38|nr:hypothetical protein [Clostridium magnum]SHJ13744.1 hypothetical protein SAMN02745944_05423 [Clostridium magnum DSM 2767]